METSKELLSFMNKHQWGGSGIERCLFEFIVNMITRGSNIVEFGSGFCSTPALSQISNVYSIDNNPQYIHHFKNVNYILANIQDNWYNREIVKNFLPKKYELVLVDGPVGSDYRSGILNNLDIFVDCKYIIHDTYRDSEKILAQNIAQKLNKQITFYTSGDYWAFIE